MAELIGLRLATRVGAWTARLARRLAEQVRRERSSQRSQVVDGFLLRGVRAGRQYKAMVIDPPSYVLFAGFSSFRVGSPTPVTLGYGAMAAGGRDDVWPPGTLAEYSTAEASSFLQLQIPSVPSGAEPAQVVFFPPVQQLFSHHRRLHGDAAAAYRYRLLVRPARRHALLHICPGVPARWRLHLDR
jgi:hypothetical protein